jgi:hypothetical protein
MSTLDETAFVERLQFFNGQRLFAEDLQAVEAFHREMRWLHNQSLHQPGIGRGLAVSGRRDEREVRVGPGYALDALGREIVLTRDRVEQVPPVSSENGGQSVFFDLAVSYPGDELLEEAETREGICLPRGVVRLREDPVLCWLRLKRDSVGQLNPADPRLYQEVQDGLRIDLARVEVLQCRLRQDVSLAERRSARPARQPYIACGSQPVTNWQEDKLGDNGIVFLTAPIDTSAAGFLTTPVYSVRLAGDRFKVENQETLFQVVDLPPSVVNPRPDGFQLQVTMFTDVKDGEPKPWNDWTAVWMGVE